MTDKSANKMWGGRFASSPAAIMEEINASVGFDKALAPQDIRASKAHAAMLGKQGIISRDDAGEIATGPTTAAVANAIAALVGVRVRQLPITSEAIAAAVGGAD